MMLQTTIPRPLARRAFDLLAFLEGRTLAHGVFEDRFGKWRRSFTVEIVGVVKDDVLELNEAFLYSDGTTDQRLWRFQRQGENRFTGTCDDALMPAFGTMGPQQCHLSYKIKLDIGDWQITVRFDDVYYRVSDTIIINRATVTKFGLRLGQAIIVFSKSH